MTKLLLNFWFLFDKKNKRKIFFLFFLVLTGTFAEIVGLGAIIPFLIALSKPEMVQNNFYFKKLYEWISPNTYNEFMIIMGLIIIVIFILQNLYLLFGRYYKFKFSTLVHYEFTSKLFRSYLKSPYSFHLRRNSSQLLRNIGAIQSIITGILLPVITIVTDLLLIISVLLILMVIDIISSLIVFGFICTILVLYFLLIKKKIKSFGKRQYIINEVLIKQFNQGLGSIKESKILGREHFFDKIYSTHLYEFDKMSKWQQTVSALPSLITQTAVVILVLLLMFIAIARGLHLEAIFISLSFFGMASIRLIPALSRMNASAILIRFYTPGFEEIYPDLKLAMSHRDPIDTNNISKSLMFQKDLKIENVSFSYEESNKPVLKQISLTIPKNSTVALVGETGSGKTTLMDIILGLLLPQKGCVSVDGVNISTYLTSWHQKVGYIPQQIYLMDDTIRANIAFGIPDEEVNLENVTSAIQLAQLEEFINDLPEGLKTIIGERGVRISGGQRQRIGIARALYNNPEVLFMDEATAALDNETERAFMNAIDSFRGKRTLIIIAHRLSTVRNVNTIFFLSKGELIASGSYNNLLEECPAFRRMAGANPVIS